MMIKFKMKFKKNAGIYTNLNNFSVQYCIKNEQYVAKQILLIIFFTLECKHQDQSTLQTGLL